MGGGVWAWAPDGAAIVYVGVDGRLWWQPLYGGGARALTGLDPDGSAAPAAPVFSLDGTRVIYTLDDAQVRWVSVDGEGAGRLDDGSDDFCIDPSPHPDGAMWQAWSVPDMPWDAAHVVSVDWDGANRCVERVAGALQQPRWAAGTRWWVTDEDGWANVARDGEVVVAEQREHAGPTWGPGQRSYAVSPDGTHVAFARNEDGFGRLCVADADGRVTEVGRGVHGQLSWEGHRLCALRSGARTPTEVVVYEGPRHTRRRVATGAVTGWQGVELAEPDAVLLDGPAGGIPARLYPATTPTGHPGEPSSRLVCWVHGGPTDQWQVTFMPRLAYWQARGWSVLVMDPRGSTGHGRAYQQALRGGWGVIDVDDVVASVHAAVAAGWATAERIVLCGGSSGGYAVLEALARPDLRVAAAVVSYPVSDLADLAERSHRYERHYTDTLVGPLPDAAATLTARSPVSHPGRLTGTPLLVMHGDRDPVVPVEQSIALTRAVTAAGGRVELHVYEGEGHGFRDPVNKLDEYERMGEFIERHVPGSVTGDRRW